MGKAGSCAWGLGRAERAGRAGKEGGGRDEQREGVFEAEGEVEARSRLKVECGCILRPTLRIIIRTTLRPIPRTILPEIRDRRRTPTRIRILVVDNRVWRMGQVEVEVVDVGGRGGVCAWLRLGFEFGTGFDAGLRLGPG